MISVKATKTYEAHDGGITKVIRQYLHHDGLACKESVLTQREADYPPFGKFRISQDNGKTYGEWTDIPPESLAIFYGDDEVIENLDDQRCLKIWNPVHKHYVRTYFHRYFINGHDAAYEAFWHGKMDGKQGFYDHQYIRIYRENEEKHYAQQLLRYEDGADFDESNPRNPEFLLKNEGYVNPPIVLENGDIMVPVGLKVDVACRIAGLDVQRVFPSAPHNFRALIIARGVFDKATELYNFTFSEPVILSDLQSSRGIDEPTMAELTSGRIVIVMRGSNLPEASWNTRIEKGAPPLKWYAYSDDGGKTFTAPQPWRFDDGEIVYSSATISDFIRLQKNGKLYWIGNITTHKAYGNFPRFPLYIAQVDEETGTLIKSTLTVIDTKREGESEYMQLSNFWMLEDRETGVLEIALHKVGQFDQNRPFYGEGWRYEVTFED